MEAALVFARLGQYLGAAGLFGGALFLARQVEDPSSGERRLLGGSAVLLFAATLMSLDLQAATMGGQSDPWSGPSIVGMVLTQTAFGAAVIVRLLVVVLAIGVVALAPPRLGVQLATGLGAGAAATLAWGGHGAADEGVAGGVHLAADIVHLLAAALWLGALWALVAMAARRRVSLCPPEARRLYEALEGFSGVGSVAVALLILTGLVNSWFLIGPTHLPALVTTLYGRLLLAKLALFSGMIGLAAANRWRHAPRLGSALDRADMATALAPLRRSVTLETAAAVGVLLAVAWLGTLAPPVSG